MYVCRSGAAYTAGDEHSSDTSCEHTGSRTGRATHSTASAAFYARPRRRAYAFRCYTRSRGNNTGNRYARANPCPCDDYLSSTDRGPVTWAYGRADDGARGVSLVCGGEGDLKCGVV